MANTRYLIALALLALCALPTACIVQGMGTLTYLNKPGVSANWAVLTSAGVENQTYLFDDQSTINGVQTYTITYKGHYGEYYVLVGRNEWGDFASVKYGGGSANDYLASELQWLSERGIIRGLASSDISQIKEITKAFGFYSAYNGTGKTWAQMQSNCNPDGLCFRCGPLPTMSDQMPNLGELDLPATGGTGLPGNAVGVGAPASGVVGASAASEFDQKSAQENGTTGAGQANGEAGFIQYLPYIMGFIVVAGVGALVLYQLAFRQQMVQQFDPATEMALSNETRLEIMRELSEAERIPTDLSLKIGKSKATVVEHLDKLVSAQLVERIETPGKKFVYYKLTGKGRTALLRRAA